MAIVNKVEKRIKVDRNDVIKYQIVTYCFMNNIQISSSDLKCLLELAKVSSMDLTDFCTTISEKKIYGENPGFPNTSQWATYPCSLPLPGLPQVRSML